MREREGGKKERGRDIPTDRGGTLRKREREAAWEKEKHQWERATERKKIKKETGVKEREIYRDTGWEGETDRKREPHRERQIRIETEAQT